MSAIFLTAPPTPPPQPPNLSLSDTTQKLEASPTLIGFKENKPRKPLHQVQNKEIAPA